MLVAAAAGDVAALRGLLARDPNLYRAEYWYTQPIHFAVREGDVEALRVLLDAGADPATVGLLDGEDLITTALDRGHAAVARLLEQARAEKGRVGPAEPSKHPIHLAAAGNDFARVSMLLDAEPDLVHRRDRAGATPLRRAVAASSRETIGLLLDRGADLHALHGPGPGLERGYPAVDFQPIDQAFWTGPFWGPRGDVETARLLVGRGAAYDLVIASALGDLEAVRTMLDADPRRIGEARPSGKHALSSAVEFGHSNIVHLLLDRGADPNWPDGAMALRCTPPPEVVIGPWSNCS
jgi:ankyrin repeat protein